MADTPRFAWLRSRPAFSAIALALALASAAAPGQEAQPPAPEQGESVPSADAVPFGESEEAAQSANLDLEAVQDDMAITEQRIAEIREEIRSMSDDSAALSAQLVAAGERVEGADTEVREIEDRLQELFAREESVRNRLDGHDRSISSLLTSLQRISAHPPPAMIVDPSDALGSARAAMLLSAVLPQLQAEAEKVVADLEQLQEIKNQAMAEADELRTNLQTLQEERLRVATIIEARQQGVDWLSEDLLIEEAEAQSLADRATSLEQLIEGLETRIAAVTAADEATRAANAGENLPRLDPETIRIALADTDRTEPAVPIASARGYLEAPVEGVNVQTYGASDGYGGIARGLSIVTAQNAEVVTPADAWVSYAGEFLNYGQIVVLNAGQDYTIVLAGLDSVSVERGAFLQMGTPIGTMGESTFKHTLATGAGTSRPTLYVEMRESGEPIDPAGWWAAAPETERSGSS